MVVPSGPRITVRNFPPGRRSISHSVVSHGLGQNHLLRWSGSVHARQTFSGGTSTTRSSTRSSFGSIFIGHLLEIGVQLIETALPDLALAAEPILGRADPPGHELVDADPTDLLRADQAPILEHVEVLRERRQRHVEG